MGGLNNIPLLIKYGIDTCDVATPWRRACTDAVSNMYVPLFDKKLNILNNKDALRYFEIYDSVWNKVSCDCPFCDDFNIKKIVKTYKKSDKRNNGNNQHSDDYYNMRVRIFFHNLFQHISLLRKLDNLKKEFREDFLKEFIKQLPQENLKKKFSKLL